MLSDKRDLVVASCGGHPFDINMIQAHKTLDAAANACSDGGTIVLLGECSDGLGRSDFLDWFDSSDRGALAKSLCSGYQVNGQTAWSLLTKAEQFDVKIVTSLDSGIVRKMRMEKIEAGEVTKYLDKKSGYIIPAGSKVCVTS
jgi:hypothetical protein